MKGVFLVILAVVLVIGAVFSGCGEAEETTTAPPTTSVPPATSAPPTTSVKPPPTTAAPPPATMAVYGGTYRYIRSDQPTATWGWPAKALYRDTDPLIPIIETLVREDNKLQIQPWLAESWEIAQDRNSITFKLRQGVKFHDGTNFDADAVKFNLDSVLNAGVTGTTYWTSVDVIDDYTVRINLSQYDNTILPSLASHAGLMASPTAFKMNGEDWACQNPVGTGPFKFVSFTRDVSLELERFDDYWQEGKPYLDGVRILYIADAMTQVAAFKAGQADALGGAPTKTMADLRDWGAELFWEPSSCSVLFPDGANADSPFGNKLVRQALEFAIDREAIAEALGYGINPPAYQWPKPGSNGYIPDLKREHDPAKAMQLLAEAGYSDGFKCKLAFSSRSKDQAVAIQNFFAEVGIDAEMEALEQAKLVEYQTKGWHDTCLVYGASSLLNWQMSVQQYFMTSGYFVSLGGPDNLEDLYLEASATLYVEPQKVQAMARAIFDDASLPVFLYGGVGYLIRKESMIHDPGYFTYSYHRMWTPEDIWMGK